MGKIASFATTKEIATNFSKETIISALVNIESEYLDRPGNLTVRALDIIKQKFIDSGLLPANINSIKDLNEWIELQKFIKLLNVIGYEKYTVDNLLHNNTHFLYTIHRYNFFY